MSTRLPTLPFKWGFPCARQTQRKRHPWSASRRPLVLLALTGISHYSTIACVASTFLLGRNWSHCWKLGLVNQALYCQNVRVDSCFRSMLYEWEKTAPRAFSMPLFPLVRGVSLRTARLGPSTSSRQQAWLYYPDFAPPTLTSQQRRITDKHTPTNSAETATRELLLCDRIAMCMRLAVERQTLTRSWKPFHLC